MPKVLVVDDSLSVRKVVERALAGRHIDVVTVASGSEALERIERESPDVIVCDVVMPDRDGYDICAFVKNHPRLGATPVLLMSGIVNDEVRARAEAARSAGVLAKPFAADDLLRRLSDLLTTPVATASAPPSVEAPASTVERPPALEPVTIPLEVSRSSIDIPPAVTSVGPVPPVVPPAPSRDAPPSIVSLPRGPAAPGPLLGGSALGASVSGSPRSDAGAARLEMPARSGASAPPGAGGQTPRPAVGVRAVIETFATMDGVQWAVITDREGFVIEATANAGVDADVAAALSACLAESSDGLGRELGRGALAGMILEYDKGVVVLYGVGASAMLAIGLTDASALGKVRYYAKKAVADLGRMV